VLNAGFHRRPGGGGFCGDAQRMKTLGGDAQKINPLVPVDLVIDHSVIVNFFGDNKAFGKNVTEEYKQNQERYEFLKWGQKAFSNFSWCRQAPVSAIRSIWNIWRRRYGRGKRNSPSATRRHVRGRLSRHAGGHGFAHHDGQRPRRAGLGRRRHLRRGGHARPAAVDAAAGRCRFKLKGQLKEGVTATDLC